MKRIVELVVDFQNKIYNTIFLKQMDTTIIKVKLLNNNIVADITSQTIDIIFTKPDNTIVQQLSSDIDVQNGIATIPLLEDCVRQSGKAKMEIEVKNTNSEVISSFYIPIQIEKTSKENINSNNTPNYFEEFAKAIDDLKQESTQMLEDIDLAEKDRILNESARIEAEDARKNNETNRINAETARVEDEERRSTAESTRIEAEDARKNNETNRIAAETARAEAEQERISAENDRVTEFNNITESLCTLEMKLEMKTEILHISQSIADNSEITIPCYYKVGNDSLMVFFNGEVLLKATDMLDGHYEEVGATDSISNKIKIHEWGCSAEPGDVFKLLVRGDYDGDSE